MKRFVSVALLVVSGGAILAEPEPAWVTGQWSGTLVADRAALLASANSPEHRALLEYAIQRAEVSEIKLLTFPSGKAQLFFDDGYRPHHREWRGMWAMEDGKIVTRFRGLTKDWSSKPLVFVIEPRGDKSFLPVVPGMPEGLSATLSRTNLTQPEPSWAPMRFKR